MSKTKNTKNQAKAVKRQKHTVVVLTYKKFSFMYRIMFCQYAKKWNKLSKKQLLLFLQLLFLIAIKMCQISMMTNYEPNICF